MTKVEIILFFSTLICGTAVISAPNPVHSVLYLIIVFWHCTIWLFLLGFDFLGILLLIVYIGAVAILFLFVVLILNIQQSIKQNTLYRDLPLSLFISISILIIIFNVLEENKNELWNNLSWLNWPNEYITSSNIHNIGNILYTQGIYYIMIAALILLIGLLGSIILIKKDDFTIQRQNLYIQISRLVIHQK